MDNYATPTQRDIERAAADNRIIVGSFDPNEVGSWYGIGWPAYSYHDLTRVPHLLVAGRTGAGKSVLLRNYVNAAKLAPESYKVVHITTDADMGFSEDIDQVKNVPLEDAETELERVVKKALPYREKMLIDAGATEWRELERMSDGDNHPHRLLVLVDGLERVQGTDSFSHNRVLNYLEEIVRIGRSLGVHLVLTTQADTPEKLDRGPEILEEFCDIVSFSYRHRGSGRAVWNQGRSDESPEFAVYGPGLD
ncbi:MAG: hypothetical protein DI609_00370 [Corynebacterium urealyticum]|uniref:FtsK domain-containing protein n=1 Tax=Corynebacterium urealyticum TaxID=43771 RepID=A0A2W5DCK1_9CORY|nr:MAG: hypothetical protein DI609_00370 [Corynebacterium urealyticum]